MLYINLGGPGSTNKYTKFGQLIIRKIIEIISTRCDILRLKAYTAPNSINFCLFVRLCLRWSWTLGTRSRQVPYSRSATSRAWATRKAIIIVRRLNRPECMHGRHITTIHQKALLSQIDLITATHVQGYNTGVERRGMMPVARPFNMCVSSSIDQILSPTHAVCMRTLMLSSVDVDSILNQAH